MSEKIKLPREEWIPVASFVQIVADSILPIKPHLIKGIHCIVGYFEDLDGEISFAWPSPEDIPLSAPSGLFITEGENSRFWMAEIERLKKRNLDQPDMISWQFRFCLLPRKEPNKVSDYETRWGVKRPTDSGEAKDSGEVKDSGEAKDAVEIVEKRKE